MNTIKAICTDLDGTLLTPQGLIPEDTISFLCQYQQNGGILILATSRHIWECESIIKQVFCMGNGYICSSNGMYEYTSDLQIENTYHGLSYDEIREIINTFSSAQITFVTNGKDLVYSNRCFLVEALKHFINNISGNRQKSFFLRKKKIDYLDDEVIEKALISGVIYDEIPEELKRKYNIMQCKANQIEIQSQKTDKYYAVNELLERLHIRADEVIVFGDNDNDRIMLEHFPRRIAMGNATSRIKSIANCVTVSNAKNGVLLTLRSEIAQR